MRRPLVLAVVGAAVLGLATGAGVGYLTRPTQAGTPAAVSSSGVLVAAGLATGPGQAPQAARSGSPTGGPAAGRAPTTGTVEQVEPTRLTVRTDDGTVDVPLSDTTVVQKLVKAAPSDLKVGDAVVGRGSADAQGQLRLTALQILPPGGPAAGPAGAAATAAPASGTPAGRPPGALRKPGGAGGGAAGRGALAGTVARIDGATLVVATADGDVTATLAEDAEVRRLTAAERDEIKAGQPITVVGAAGGRTVVTITAV
jgi:hypothetical protein